MTYESIYPEIKKLSDSARIVSFDVFDTLVFRIDPETGDALCNPDDMFFNMEKSMDIPGFAAARINAETLARARAYSPNSKFREITLDDIYSIMPQKFRKIKSLEIRYEIENARCNFQLADAYNHIRNEDKYMIIASDMYLPAQTIAEILNNNNITYSHYEKLYVSSEIGATKKFGTLFGHITRDLGVRPHEILHIGDNKLSDYDMALKMGLNAWYYKGMEK